MYEQSASDLRIGTTRIRIKVDHRATDIAHRDAYSRPLGRLAEQEDASQPLSSSKGFGRSRRTTMFGRNRRRSCALLTNLPISRTVSAAITETLASSEEYQASQVRHMDWSAMATLDLRSQFLAEDGHLPAFGRPNVRRKVPLDTVFVPDG